MNRRNLNIIIARLVLLPVPLLPLIVALILNWQEKALHRYMKDELKRQELVTVIVPEQDISWREYGEELVLENGKYFDVKYYSLKDGYYILTGLYDEKEAYISRQLQVKGEESTSGNKLAETMPFLYDVYFENSEPALITPIPGADFFNDYTVPLSLRVRAVHSPPPRNLFA